MSEIVGLLAGACTTLSFLPQVLKVWSTKSAKDISLGMYVLFCIGIVLWIIYGVLIGAPSIIIVNCITFLLASLILIMKFRWKDK